MADSRGRTELIPKIQELLKQQLECCTDATFLGWTHELTVAHEKRADLIRLLCLELATHDGSIQGATGESNKA
jgi:hypothetical protein